MSITDELRKVAAKTECANGRCEKLYRGDLERIADRIDAEHEGELLETGNNILRDVSREWVRLPKDADGECIHVGDVMEHNGVRANVLGITFHGTTPPTVCIVRGDCWVEADELHHVKQPTVEDVLTEFGIDWEYESDCEDRAALLKEYASKLRLAEGEDA